MLGSSRRGEGPPRSGEPPAKLPEAAQHAGPIGEVKDRVDDREESAGSSLVPVAVPNGRGGGRGRVEPDLDGGRGPGPVGRRHRGGRSRRAWSRESPGRDAGTASGVGAPG